MRASRLYGWTVLAAAALFTVNTVIFTLELTVNLGWPPFFAHLLNPIIAVLAVSLCLRATRAARSHPIARRFWRLTSTGMILMWSALMIRPVSITTDVVWLDLAVTGLQTTGALFLGLSIATIPLGLRTLSDRIALLLDSATLLIAAAVVVWHFFGTAARDAFSGGTTPNVGPIMASALIGVLLAAKAGLAGSDMLPRGTLYLRSFAALVGGLGVAASALLATRPDIDALVLLGPMASTSVGLSAWHALRHRPDAAAERGRRRRYSLLPYVGIAGVAALLVHVAWTRATDLLLVVAAAVVLTGLVVVRQLVSFRENDVLLTRLGEHEQQLRHDATHDALTGLANRTLLRERIDAALERVGDRRRLSVALIDLDDFKTVNDTLGHSVGDALLVTVADRMRANVRSTDLVARLGGDEFALLFEDLDHGAVESLIARIAEALAMPVQVEEHLLVVRASFGVVDAADLTSAGDLMRRADIAMYEAKARGEGGLQRYREGMETRGLERHRVASELRAAIDADQLVLHYQPVVTLPEGRITGVEALVRWQHPSRGLLGPGEFIEIAEQTGLIVPLGRWVLRTATRQAAAWVAEGGLESVAVNISARHLQCSGLAGEVAAALRDSGLPARCLTIELTESAAVGGGATQDTLRELRTLGVRLSLDDFGTGASTLSLLVNCPVDEIKLDRTFTPAPGPDAIAGAVLQLARAMGIEAVAEGVETPEQAAKLSSLGYEHAQGFHFARPMPAAELEKALHVTAVAP